MAQCEYCNHEIKDGAKFCGTCGAAVKAQNISNPLDGATSFMEGNTEAIQAGEAQQSEAQHSEAQQSKVQQSEAQQSEEFNLRGESSQGGQTIQDRETGPMEKSSQAQGIKQGGTYKIEGSYTPQSYKPENNAPQTYTPQNNAPQTYTPQTYAPRSYTPSQNPTSSPKQTYGQAAADPMAGPQGHGAGQGQKGGYYSPQGPVAVKKAKSSGGKWWIIGGVGGLVVLLTIVVLLISFLGKGKDVTNDDNPILGLWTASIVEAEGMEMNAYDVFGEFSLDIKDKNICTVITPEDIFTAKWTLKKDIMTIEVEGEGGFSGTVEGDTFTVDDYMSMGYKIQFIKNYKGEAGTDDSMSGMFGDSSDPGDSDLQGVKDIWNGDWYGYMWVTNAWGEWIDYEDFFSDANMVIDLNEDGNGVLSIHLEGAEETAVESTVKADLYGLDFLEGYFIDMSIDSLNWWMGIDLENIGHRVMLSDAYVDPEGQGDDGFDFIFVFKPYGHLWDKEIENGEFVPPGYDIYSSNIGGLGSKPDGEGESGGDEYTDEEILPVFTFDELEDIYYIMSISDNYTYEEARDIYFEGQEGVLDEDNENFTAYKWFAKDREGAFIRATFKDEDGYEDRIMGSSAFIR